MKARVPASVLKLITLLGADKVDKVADLLLAYGGQEIYVASGDRATFDTGDKIRSLLGDDLFHQLALKVGGNVLRIPLGQSFLVRYYRAKGLSQSTIASKVRATWNGVYKTVTAGVIDRSIEQDGKASAVLAVDMIVCESSDFANEAAE